MTELAITERAQKLLKLLIETFISKGVPVGSKYLAEKSEIAVSSATVRNILADLEEMGYLHSPHTSAGRVPTEQGYRFFINSLLQVKDLDNRMIETYQQELDDARDKNKLLQSTSSLLSNVTSLAGVVSLPRNESHTLRHVEFLPLSGQRLLVILVTNEAEVQNRIISVDRDFQMTELEQIGNMITEHYAGKDLTVIRQEILLALQTDKEQMNRLMQQAISVAERALIDDTPEKDYVVAGQENLLNIADEAGIDQLRSVFDAFTEKQKILNLFDKCLQADGLQIFIGMESGFENFANCSVVTAPYSIDGQAVGVIGVVGPTRMAYDNIIPIVDVTSRILSAALN